MRLPAFEHGETVEVWRAALIVDDLNNTIPGAYMFSHNLERTLVAPGSTDENTALGRQSVSVDMTVYADIDADVIAHDRLKIRGEMFTVEGDPERWNHQMTDWEAGTRVYANRIEG